MLLLAFLSDASAAAVAAAVVAAAVAVAVALALNPVSWHLSSDVCGSQ